MPIPGTWGGMTDSPEEAHLRQRRLYDRLWTAGRDVALSPDLIRFRVWGPHLRSPVVDIGAGDALLARSFSSLRIFSVDVSDVGIRQVAPKAVVAAAETLPIRSGSARTVVLSEVLEHASQPAGVLSECRRILSDDGLLLLSTPLWPIARTAYIYFWQKIGERPSLRNLSKWDPEHERRYRLGDLLAEVRQSGFEPVEVTPLFGSATATALYVIEPLMARFGGRRPRLAQRLTGVDRLIRPVDRPSAAALVCRPDGPPGS